MGGVLLPQFERGLVHRAGEQQPGTEEPAPLDRVVHLLTVQVGFALRPAVTTDGARDPGPDSIDDL